MTDNTSPATSGAWRRRTYADSVPQRSLGVSPDHLHGSFPAGKAPTSLPTPNIPVVVIEGAGDWGAFDFHGGSAGWQRLGDTDTTSHEAYDVSSGVPIEVVETENMILRSEDRGAVAGRLHALGESEWEHHQTTQFQSPKAGSPGYNGGGIATRREKDGTALNNPEGIPGHETPRVQRWGDVTRQYAGKALRTHNAHVLHDRRAWAHAPSVRTEGDLYGSPFDSQSVITTNGARSPVRQQVPGMWDESVADAPADAGDEGFGFDYA